MNFSPPARGRQRVVIVGGGIVGLATARALRQRGVAAVILEAEARLGAHQTGRNSGVIHSGLYYRPGSLKAQTCSRGRDLMYAFCAERGIPHRRTGKVVVATSAEEVPRLEQLLERGRLNGLADIRRLTAAELREVEPEVAGVAALWVPQTGIVDYAAVLEALRAELAAAGVETITASPVQAIRREATGLALVTPQGVRQANFVINCAGLQSDRVARLCGARPDIRIVPFRGEYYLLRPERAHLVRHPIYPVPDPAFPFLGVHFTPRVDGRVDAGPNAVLAWHRHGYHPPAFSPRDAWETLAWPGFRRLAARHWRTGLDEQFRSWSKARFVRSLQRLVPAVEGGDLTPTECGVRAQAVGRDGALVDDFLVLESANALHVLNAPSPAATASLAIGDLVAERALNHPSWA